jgi:Concanavalin A-like lectin/glucanases superfamily
MSNKVKRGRVLVGVMAATMLVVGGCADLSDINDPNEDVELLPIPDPPGPAGPNELDPKVTGPVLVEQVAMTPVKPKPIPPSKQVLQVNKGGKLVVKRDEQLAQSISGDTTLELWVWIETMADQPLVRMGNISLQIHDRRVRAQLDGAALESAVVTSREWYHLTLVTEADQLRLYVNGQMSGSVQAPTQWELDDETITFGGRQKVTGAFSGKLDNIRLTSQALYHGADFSPSQQLVALDNMALAYDFDQQHEGEEVEDLSGNDRHGQISGDATLVAGAI